MKPRAPRPRKAEQQLDAALARRSLLRADRDLVDSVDAVLAGAARKAGAHLVCRAGCSECCYGPFPINRLDAFRLQEGWRALRQRDPEKAEAVMARTRAAVKGMTGDFPGDGTKGRLGGDEEAEDQFFERHAGEACPVLDPATQTCTLYEHRPVSCRIYGPPLRVQGEELAPCRLCFTEADEKTIESCRVEPDPHGLERAILQRLKRDGGDDRETVIAWAVLEAADGADKD